MVNHVFMLSGTSFMGVNYAGVFSDSKLIKEAFALLLLQTCCPHTFVIYLKFEFLIVKIGNISDVCMRASINPRKPPSNTMPL